MFAEKQIDPRIYVVCRASCGNGVQHGKWIEAAQDKEGLEADVHGMLASSSSAGAMQFAIEDHEGFGEITLHEHECLETVARVASIIKERGKVLGEVFYALVSHFDDIKEAEAAMSERYQGSWNSVEDWADHFLGYPEENITPEDAPLFVVDVEAFAEVWERNGRIMAIRAGGSTHVFLTEQAQRGSGSGRCQEDTFGRSGTTSA